MDRGLARMFIYIVYTIVPRETPRQFLVLMLWLNWSKISYSEDHQLNISRTVNWRGPWLGSNLYIYRIHHCAKGDPTPVLSSSVLPYFVYLVLNFTLVKHISQEPRTGVGCGLARMFIYIVYTIVPRETPRQFLVLMLWLNWSKFSTFEVH